MRSPILLLALAAGCGETRPAQFDCGKVICEADEICLHWDILDSAPPDAGHGCVEAPAGCDGLPTCDCASEVCAEDCAVEEGLSCHGDSPE